MQNFEVQRNVNLISRQELSNEYLVAKFGFDQAENEYPRLASARMSLLKIAKT